MTIPKTCDVAIIGGGPTGSSAANSLAAQGFDAVLLDKATHPRNTVGESLIPHFWRYTDKLGASQEILDAGFIAKSGGLALWGNELRGIRFRDFGYDRQALHVERDVFDDILLRTAERAGARVFEGVQVTGVEGLDAPLTTLNWRTAEGDEGRLQARYVIDASGQAAVVASQLKLRVFDEALRFSAFWGYYAKSRYLTFDCQVRDDGEKHAHPPATLISTIGDWGWAWKIVMRETVSVGIVLPKARLAELRGKTQAEREARFRRRVAEIPLMGRLLDADDFIPGSLMSIRDYAYKPLALTQGNCYLAGDAAAFVDPINSLGVVLGMFSGLFAAHAVSRSLEKPSDAQFNSELYRLQFGNRLALFRLLALPEGAAHLTAEDLRKAKQAVAASSDAELQLMEHQASINLRQGVLHGMFDELGIAKREKIETIDWQALPI